MAALAIIFKPMTLYFRAILTLFLFGSALGVYAQSNFYRMSVEAGAGLNYLFGDATKKYVKPQIHLGYEYQFMRFISFGTKAQFGQTSGEYVKGLTNDRFTNRFSNFQIYSKYNLGMFIPAYALENSWFWKHTHGLYAGVGFGFQKNSLNETNISLDPMGNELITPIKTNFKSTAGFIPIIAGYDYFINDEFQKTKWAISFNYQLVIGLDDNLDGGFRVGGGNFNDFNNTITFGFRYFFGPYGLDKNR